MRDILVTQEEKSLRKDIKGKELKKNAQSYFIQKIGCIIIVHPQCDGNSISINACKVWGVRVRVQISKRGLHTHIHFIEYRLFQSRIFIFCVCVCVQRKKFWLNLAEVFGGCCLWIKDKVKRFEIVCYTNVLGLIAIGSFQTLVLIDS